MSLPAIASRAEWLAARLALLGQEKAMTRALDGLNAARRELPMVEVGKRYTLHGAEGAVGLPELFAGMRQLIVRHFMFDPRSEEGCPSCSASAEEISEGLLAHLRARDTAHVVIARAPLAKIEAFKQRKGWSFPWYSSYGSDFNFDFNVTVDETVAPAEYNYRTRAEHERAGTGYYFEGEQPLEQPGFSCFLRDGERIFHTYSCHARGMESVGGANHYLDLTALGRQEAWERPAGRTNVAHQPTPDFALDGDPSGASSTSRNET